MSTGHDEDGASVRRLAELNGSILTLLLLRRWEVRLIGSTFGF